MRYIFVAITTALLMTTTALADTKPTAEETTKIKEAISVLGCTGGEFEKEDEASGLYEIDDAKCHDGKQFDIKLDDQFRVIDMSRD